VTGAPTRLLVRLILPVRRFPDPSLRIEQTVNAVDRFVSLFVSKNVGQEAALLYESAPV
jgi:hypothetical protein